MLDIVITSILKTFFINDPLFKNQLFTIKACYDIYDICSI